MSSKVKRKRRKGNELWEDDEGAADGMMRVPSSDEDNANAPTLKPVFLKKKHAHSVEEDAQINVAAHLDDHPDNNSDDFVPRRSHRQHEYLQQFVDRSDALLGALLDREALPPNKVCDTANCAAAGRWRCRDCTIPQVLCRGCMRKSHMQSPLHNVEYWEGKYFRGASLRETGCYLLVGHRSGVSLCDSIRSRASEMDDLEARYDTAADTAEAQGPAASELPDSAPSAAPQVGRDHPVDDGTRVDEILEEDEEDDHEEDDEWGFADDPPIDGPAFRPYIPQRNDLRHNIVRVVHTNGIHHIALITCTCRGVDEVCLDLMYRRLVVTSFVNHRTLFTADVLDYFRLLNLELKGSAYQFFQLLRRLTLPLAPAEAPNLYKELRRLSRLWRWMKKRKWAGEGQGDGSTPCPAAELLVPFCPACPQPHRNLPENWKWSIIKWIYRRYFVIDGNFKADHVRQKAASRDLWLSKGRGMMPNPEIYAEFLKTAVERRTKAPCETHFRAIEQALLASKACDITGVIAVSLYS